MQINKKSLIEQKIFIYLLGEEFYNKGSKNDGQGNYSR